MKSMRETYDEIYGKFEALYKLACGFVNAHKERYGLKNQIVNVDESDIERSAAIVFIEYLYCAMSSAEGEFKTVHRYAEEYYEKDRKPEDYKFGTDTKDSYEICFRRAYNKVKGWFEISNETVKKFGRGYKELPQKQNNKELTDSVCSATARLEIIGLFKLYDLLLSRKDTMKARGVRKNLPVSKAYEAYDRAYEKVNSISDDKEYVINCLALYKFESRCMFTMIESAAKKLADNKIKLDDKKIEKIIDLWSTKDFECCREFMEEICGIPVQIKNKAAVVYFYDILDYKNFEIDSIESNSTEQDLVIGIKRTILQYVQNLVLASVSGELESELENIKKVKGNLSDVKLCDDDYKFAAEILREKYPFVKEHIPVETVDYESDKKAKSVETKEYEKKIEKKFDYIRKIYEYIEKHNALHAYARNLVKSKKQKN